MKRTRQQTQAIETTARSVCVDAGAGSGKTRVLIERLVRLLDPRAGDVDFDRVVAITFTNKAAAEMRSRLRKAAHAMAEAPGAKREFWRSLERKLDAARIDTIDAFCLKLLKEHALALHLDPEVTLLSDAEHIILQDEVLRRTLNALLDGEDAGAVRLAVHFGPSSLRKSLESMLAHRALTDAAVAPWLDLKPAEMAGKSREMARAIYLSKVSGPKVRRRLRALHGELQQWDDHCLVAGDKREEVRRLAMALLEAALRVTRLDEWHEVAAGFDRIGLRGGSPKAWADSGAKDAIRDTINAAKAFFQKAVPMEDPALTRQAAAYTHDLIALYHAVTAAIDAEKERRQAFYFDDIMRMTVAALEHSPGLRREVAGGIEHLLIDEFQDTDPRQLIIADLLHSEPNGPALFIVGDAKQSIYRFRGAEVSVFDKARRGSLEEISMGRNHRTVPEVLAFVNDFFARSEVLEAVESPYRPMESWRPPTRDARVELLLPITDKAVSADEGRELEADLIAARLVQMCETAPVTVGDGTLARPATYGDAALLLRATSKVSVYERALRKAGVPYYVVAGKGFYERQEVVDIRNLLAVVSDPFDEISLAGYLRSPMAGLSDDALFALTQTRSLAAAFASGVAPDEFGEGPAWERARRLVLELQGACERPLPALVTLALDSSGYEAMLLGLPLGETRAANVRKVIDLAAEFATVEGASLRRFIAYMDEVAHREIQEGEAGIQREGTDAVAIMTIHKSKGLEFPIVCVPELGRQVRHADWARVVVHRDYGIALSLTGEDGSTAPSWLHSALSSVREDEDDAERMRILYVAMTRAQDWLLLSAGARGTGRTWLELFEAEFEVDRRGDGEVVKGEGWQAMVRRVMPVSAGRRPHTRSAVPLDAGAALRRVQPLEHAPWHGSSVSVSALLQAMAPVEAHGAAVASAGVGLLDASQRGTIVHRFLECWDFASEASAVGDALLRDEFPMPGTESLLDELERIAGYVQVLAFAPALGDEATRREQAFALRLAQDALLIGTIDAILPDGTLVDWKTGAFRADSHARYGHQLRLYAAAAAALDRPAPGAWLVYVDAQRVESVDVSTKAVEETLELARAAMQRLRKAAALHVDEDA